MTVVAAVAEIMWHNHIIKRLPMSSTVVFQNQLYSLVVFRFLESLA